jgi:HEAT repeat protein
MNRYLAQLASCETAAQAVRIVESLADVHDDEALAALLHVAAYPPNDPLPWPAVRILKQRGDRRAREPLQAIYRALLCKEPDIDADGDMYKLLTVVLGAIVALSETQEKLDLLESRDSFERSAAATALGAEDNASEIVIPALLVHALQDSDKYVQRGAITSLICLGYHADLHVDQFLGIYQPLAGQLPVVHWQIALSNTSLDSRTRACAAWVLGALRAKPALVTLQHACNDSDRVVAAQATWALNRLLKPD